MFAGTPPLTRFRHLVSEAPVRLRMPGLPGFATVPGMSYCTGSRPVALMPADSLLQFRRIAMDPVHDRGRVYLHAALLHHLRQITVGDPVLAVSADTRADDLDRKATTLEREQAPQLPASDYGTSVKRNRANRSQV